MTDDINKSETTDWVQSTGDERDAEAERLIRAHVGLAVAGGAVPIPIVDLAAVTAVQLDMLKKLASLYEVPFDGSSSRAFVVSLTSALGGSMAARLAASAVKLIPGVGSIAGAMGQVAATGASTYAVGNLFRRMLREGKSIDDVDVESVKLEAAEYYELGKGIALDMIDKVRGGNPDDDE